MLAALSSLRSVAASVFRWLRRLFSRRKLPPADIQLPRLEKFYEHEPYSVKLDGHTVYGPTDDLEAAKRERRLLREQGRAAVLYAHGKFRG